MSVDLTCAGVSKQLGDKPVLRSLDLNVAASEVVTLLGASGSGKTTLLRIIAGLLEPDQGIINIGGQIVWGQRPAGAARTQARCDGVSRLCALATHECSWEY